MVPTSVRTVRVVVPTPVTAGRGGGVTVVMGSPGDKGM